MRLLEDPERLILKVIDNVIEEAYQENTPALYVPRTVREKMACRIWDMMTDDRSIFS